MSRHCACVATCRHEVSPVANVSPLTHRRPPISLYAKIAYFTTLCISVTPVSRTFRDPHGPRSLSTCRHRRGWRQLATGDTSLARTQSVTHPIATGDHHMTLPADSTITTDSTPPAPSWTSRCTCAHIAGKHTNSKRWNNAGPCLWDDCPCRGFTLAGGAA